MTSCNERVMYGFVCGSTIFYNTHVFLASLCLSKIEFIDSYTILESNFSQSLINQILCLANVSSFLLRKQCCLTVFML